VAKLAYAADFDSKGVYLWYTTNKQLGASSLETTRMDGANSGKPSVNGDGNPELGK